MSGWIFVTGRNNETSPGEVVPAGATTIPLAGADETYATGDLLFISESDGSETQWLGRVSSVTAEQVAFTRPLAASKDSTALLWAAAHHRATPARPDRPLELVTRPGVAVEPTLGGQTQAASVAEPRTTLRLRLGGLSAAERQGLFEWLGARAGWGLNPFTLIGPDGRLEAVRLSGEPIGQRREAGGLETIELPLILLGEGQYQ